MPSIDSSSARRRLAVAFLPLGLCLLLGWAVTLGPFGLGGGEKDILILLPLALWSLVFAISSLAMWVVGATLAKSSRVSALIGVGVLGVALVTLVVKGA